MHHHGVEPTLHAPCTPPPHPSPCVQALPHTLAAQTLLSNSLALLLDGSLLPPAAGSTAATAAGEAQAAAVLACLAAGPPGGRLSAMLSAALGLDWPNSPAVAAAAVAAGSNAAAVAAAAPAGRSAKSRKSVLLLGGTMSSAEAGGPECDGDDVACTACGSRDRADAMLLCDGCEAGLHMDCLDPALTDVPQGDWLCPDCCEQVGVLC
jgi:hypothetical protein